MGQKRKGICGVMGNGNQSQYALRFTLYVLRITHHAFAKSAQINKFSVSSKWRIKCEEAASTVGERCRLRGYSEWLI
jgi:hypothetical protein